MPTTFSYPPVGPPSTGPSKKQVDYFYDQGIGGIAYAAQHPMKPSRVRLAHSMVLEYGLPTKMKIFRPRQASKLEMQQFHADDYIEFLSKVTHENLASMNKDQQKFNVGDDSPVFDGLFEYCAISAGGSLEGAARLGRGKADIAVNWAGGLHHAKKSEASGFCYVNDIVLAILELLRYHERVLYIDIDVHHGDGVEEAFFTTDRVMTVSFHQYGEFFPGTGELRDVGTDKGKNYSVNFPLRHGIDDASYKGIFEPVMEKVMEHYNPGAVVLQCGGDSLAGDRLGSLNLSMRGHANCVEFMKKFNVPLLLLGGGGYTMKNVSRTWAYETGVAVGVELPAKIPYHEYSDYYGPDYELDVKANEDMHNMNSTEYLEKIKTKIFENLRHTIHAPSVEMQDVPPSMAMTDEEQATLDDMDEDENPDVRYTDRRADQYVEAVGELSDSDYAESGPSNGVKAKGKRNVASHHDDPSPLSEVNDIFALRSPSQSGSTAAAQDGDVEMRDASPTREKVIEDSMLLSSPSISAGTITPAASPKASSPKANVSSTPEAPAPTSTEADNLKCEASNNEVPKVIAQEVKESPKSKEPSPSAAVQPPVAQKNAVAAKVEAKEETTEPAAS